MASNNQSDKTAVISIVRSMAGSNGVDPDLAQAIAEQETGCDGTKCRYEENYTYLVNPDKFAQLLGISEATETLFQKTSWGPMQVMGANCRSMGYQAQLPLLVQTQLGAMYGVRFLRSLLKAHNDHVGDAISSYNQGSPVKLSNTQYKNQAYVSSVLEKLVRIKKTK